MRWLIIGLSGATCAGKTTLAARLQADITQKRNQFSENPKIGCVKIIHQDDFFYPDDSPNHTVVEELNHVNYDVITALDMDSMRRSIRSVYNDDESLLVGSPCEDEENVTVNILIIDGFIIYEDPEIVRLCHLKFFLDLPYEKCFQRRTHRVYDPPDVQGYFELCVWPHFFEYQRKVKELDGLVFLNGEVDQERISQHMINAVKDKLK